MCNLGYIYEYGRTGKRDYEKAFHFYLQAEVTQMPVTR
ncbi:SEL1-like repeat protein [uncultured Lactobacillus sp.]|nr:SEL1-like repeat protein [uncultured Lactobacillus sp.]